jgi:N-formylglutamate amidohydrolase
MKAILHIPHSSLILPDEFYEYLLIDRKQLQRYNLDHTDLYTKELFENDLFDTVIAPYSRLYCDVERFSEDENEPMSKYGQGLLYTHMFDGTLFHRSSFQYKERVLDYYHNHHKVLNRLSSNVLKNNEKLLILDCHSFKDSVASYFFDGEFPDIDLGIEPDFYNGSIIELLTKKFNANGYSVEINNPYKGSLVPNEIYKSKNPNVCAVMIEINKRIYLNEDNTIDNIKFKKLRAVILDILNSIALM